MPKYAITLSAPELLNRLDADVHEVILEHLQLARSGRLETDALIETAQAAKARGLRVVLAWDILAHDSDLIDGAALVRSLPLALFDAIRAQDPGVASYIRQNFPEMPLQLILETGNHNLKGIQTWAKALQPERLILSNEIPLDMIGEMIPQLPCEVEMVALGRLLIFYSPRKLLSPAVSNEEVEELDVVERFATEDLSRKVFPIVENRHGTFMYYEKDLNLMANLELMGEAGVAWARVDLRFFEASVVDAANAVLKDGSEANLDVLRKAINNRQTGGFFKRNRTDKQFKKLKNQHLSLREDAQFVGSVLETKRKAYTAIHTETPIAVGDILRYVIPEGEELELEVSWLSKPGGEKVSTADSPGLWLVNHARKASSGTRFYR